MNKKWLLVFISALSIFSVVVIIAFSRADNYAKERIIRYVHESSYGKYALKIHEIDFSLIPLSVRADNVELHSIDSTFVAIDSTHKILPSIFIEKIDIEGLALIKALLGKDISISALKLTDPNIFLVSTTDSVSCIHWENTGSGSNRFSIKNISIENGKIKWYGNKSSVSTNLNIAIHDFNLKSPKNPWVIEMNVAFSNIIYKAPDGFYDIKCDSFSMDYPKGDVVFSKIAIDPLIDKYEIGHAKGHESDWDSLNIESVKLSGFKPDKLLNDSLVIENVDIVQLTGVIFRDTRLKFPTIPDTKLPYENLSKFHGFISIDSVHLTGSHLIYQEHVEGSQKAGEVSFNQIEVHGGPISNAQGTVLNMDAKSKLMDTGWMNATFKIPLSADGGKHQVKGELSAMDLSSLNSMFMYVAGANIQSGNNHTMKFNFSYDKYISSGEMDFIYDDLKVKFINTKEEKIKAGLKETFMTLLVNTFVLQEANKPGRSYRKGKIEFERDPKKSIFNYWWKSLFSGIKSSTGFTEKKKR